MQVKTRWKNCCSSSRIRVSRRISGARTAMPSLSLRSRNFTRSRTSCDAGAAEVPCGEVRGFSLWWNVTGFEGADEIYHEDIELDPDTFKSYLQDLAKQHLVRGDRNKPALWEVSLNRGAPRLSYVCGVDPHYVAIAIEPEE